jgi:hypothetical protein
MEIFRDVIRRNGLAIRLRGYWPIIGVIETQCEQLRRDAAVGSGTIHRQAHSTINRRPLESLSRSRRPRASLSQSGEAGRGAARREQRARCKAAPNIQQRNNRPIRGGGPAY